MDTDASSAASTLLSLPDVLLREVLSWIPDSGTANALLSSCQTPHRLRQDPAAAALLLLRRPTPCVDYGVALGSCGGDCQGGAGAVVQQLLQWLHAPCAGCGASREPQLLPPQLVQASLYAASEKGDATTIKALLALPYPPDLNGDDGLALRRSLQNVPDVAALQALLEGGADSCRFYVHGLSLFALAADTPAGLPALQLLLKHCSPQGQLQATISALSAAADANNVSAVKLLLPAAIVAAAAAAAAATATAAMEAAAAKVAPAALYVVTLHAAGAAAAAAASCNPAYFNCLMQTAAKRGDLALLELLLDHCHFETGQLSGAMFASVARGQVGSAALLLGRGVDPDHFENWALRTVVGWETSGEPPTYQGVEGTWARVGPAQRAAELSMVRMLFSHGATVTPEVVAAGRRAGCPELVLLLQQPDAAALPAATKETQ